MSEEHSMLLVKLRDTNALVNIFERMWLSAEEECKTLEAELERKTEALRKVILAVDAGNNNAMQLACDAARAELSPPASTKKKPSPSEGEGEVRAGRDGPFQRGQVP
jgi:hypothetical protein